MPLDNIHNVLRDDLLGISKQCESLRKDIAQFVSIVSTLPAEMVKLRLMTMTLHIMTQAQNLSKQHPGMGYVFIMAGKVSFGIYWVEKEYSAEDKEDFRRRGYLIVSPEAMAEVAKQLSERVDSGQLTEAVNWLNRYEPFLKNDWA